jgi:hypothetical protein
VIRRNIADGAPAFFTTRCPAGTPVTVLVTVEGRRWAIKDGFEMAKNELGLDHSETRSPAFAGAGLERLAPAPRARHAGLRDTGRHPPPSQHRRTLKKQPADDPQEPAPIRWSVQEIPPSRSALGATPDPTRRPHRLVPLAPRPSSRRATGSPQVKNPTGVLGPAGEIARNLRQGRVGCSWRNRQYIIRDKVLCRAGKAGL